MRNRRLLTDGRSDQHFGVELRPGFNLFNSAADFGRRPGVSREVLQFGYTFRIDDRRPNVAHSVARSPERRTLRSDGVKRKADGHPSRVILRAITSIHSRVRIAVLPARSIEAPNHRSTSNASLSERDVFVFRLGKDGMMLRLAIIQPASPGATILRRFWRLRGTNGKPGWSAVYFIGTLTTMR